MKTPYELAKEVYGKEYCPRTFEEDLQLHFTLGFVCSRPDFFIMGRPVDSTAPVPRIVNPRFHFPPPVTDCWHVYLAAGDLSKAWVFLPYYLPLMSFERKNQIKIYSLDRVQRLFCKP